jgi:hypothetical protein
MAAPCPPYGCDEPPATLQEDAYKKGPFDPSLQGDPSQWGVASAYKKGSFDITLHSGTEGEGTQTSNPPTP